MMMRCMIRQVFFIFLPYPSLMIHDACHGTQPKLSHREHLPIKSAQVANSASFKMHAMCDGCERIPQTNEVYAARSGAGTVHDDDANRPQLVHLRLHAGQAEAIGHHRYSIACLPAHRDHSLLSIVSSEVHKEQTGMEGVACNCESHLLGIRYVLR